MPADGAPRELRLGIVAASNSLDPQFYQSPSLRCRKRVEEVLGSIKVPAGPAKVKLRSKPKVEAIFAFVPAAYNRVRVPKLLAKAAG